MIKWRFLSCVVLGAACSLGANAEPLTAVPVKQVAAPAADIDSGLLMLPDPALSGTRSHSALLPVVLEAVDGRWTWSMPIEVREAGARVVFLSAEEAAWNARLITPAGGVVSEDAVISRNAVGAATLISHEQIEWVSVDRSFACFQTPPAMNGTWTISISSDDPAAGYVLVDSGSDASMYTHVVERSTLVSKPITLRSQFSDAGQIQSLHADIKSPSGKRIQSSALRDSSEISFVPDETGSYSIRVEARGVGHDGRSLVLTTQQLVHVESQAPALGGMGVDTSDPERIGFGFAPDESARRTIIAAEVWGRSDGRMIPVCWISQICAQQRELSLDSRWIAHAKVDPNSLELRSLRVHDVDSFVPIEIVDSLSVGPLQLDVQHDVSVVTREMLEGRGDRAVDSPMNRRPARVAQPGHRLMLVHGYCTDATPFPLSHFSGDLAVFEDFEQSRTHDAFALEMLSQSSPMKSFGVVGHSQAGMAALHLSTFYWSGLDWAEGDRLIQTVGAPYQGTALAGNAAVLGDLFGFGCGVNDNMTYTGSANWLSLIPSWARARVWYWTTSFEERPFVYDYCNFITDLLLGDPDDGVIEQSAGQLSGANNMGHTEDWCHTSGMRDPAQCTDQSRNTQMNQRARR